MQIIFFCFFFWCCWLEYEIGYGADFCLLISCATVAKDSLAFGSTSKRIRNYRICLIVNTDDFAVKREPFFGVDSICECFSDFLLVLLRCVWAVFFCAHTIG